MNERAGSRPPTNSMMTWTEGSASTRAASGVIGSFLMSRPSRGRVRSTSATAARVSRHPARSSSIARRDSRILATPAPTVPRPSNPILTSVMSVGPPGRNGRSAGELLEPAERLFDPLLVLDEREPHVALAVLAEPDARRDGHPRFLDEHVGELERAQRAERLGDWRPDEHRALGLRHRPAELVEPVDEDVAALSVDLDDLGHARLIALERDDAGDLDRLEGAVVQIGLDARQRMDHPGVAAHEGEPPAGHVVRLRRREDLDADLLRPRNLEERRWLVAVEREVGVREVVDDHQPLIAREGDDFLEERAVHAHGRRIVREREK